MQQRRHLSTASWQRGKKRENSLTLTLANTGVNLQDNETFNAYFQNTIQTPNLIENPIKLLAGSRFKLSTQIEVNKPHLTQEAHVIVVAVYQPRYQQPRMIFQPIQNSAYWQTVTDNLQSQHYVPRLPKSLHFTFANPC